MNEEVLNLIKKYSAKGYISDAERKEIFDEANSWSVDSAEVERCIQEHLPKKSNSGFLTNEDKIPENNNQNSGSGFINENNQNPLKKDGESVVYMSENVFTDVKPLGLSGAMGDVYLAKKYGNFVIVKRIKPPHDKNETYVKLFKKEFDTAYNLIHPNIVRTLDFGQDSQGLYYCMDYVDGRSLKKTVHEEKFFEKNPDLVKHSFLQILDALNYMHAKGIFHRDLKPDNMLLTYKGDNIRIIDFGLASVDNQADSLVVAGTPFYASPEQMGKAYEADQRSDIFSLGLILLEMITANMKSVENRDTSKVTDKRFKCIIEKCIKQNPEERFHNCKQIIDLLNLSDSDFEKVYNEKCGGKNSVVINNNNEEKTEPIIPPNPEPKPLNLPLIIGVSAAVILVVLLVVFRKSIFGGGDNNSGGDKYEYYKNEADKLSQAGNCEMANRYYDSCLTVKPDDEYAKSHKKDCNTKPTTCVEKENADKMFNEKNIARALKLYKEAKAKCSFDKAIEKRIEECQNIINSAAGLKPKNGATGKFGYEDKRGYIVIDFEYDEAQPYFSNLSAAKKNGKYGFIDDKGKIVTDFVYDKIEKFGPGYKAHDNTSGKKILIRNNAGLEIRNM